MEKFNSQESPNWTNVNVDPIAGLYAFSSGLDLVDLNGDGVTSLVIADLGTGLKDMKLKVIKNTSIKQEQALMDLPAGILSVYMDLNEPRVPGIIVGSGPSLYVYKNLRPFYKYNLPLLDVNENEAKLWNQVSENQLTYHKLQTSLEKLETDGATLTERSLQYIDLEDKDQCCQFIEDFKHVSLKNEDVITCLATLKKSLNEADAIASVVVGCESKIVYIIDSEAFTPLQSFTLPSIPCFMKVSGIFDVSFVLYAACRNGKVYICKKDIKDGKLCFEVNSQIVGLERIHKHLIVAKMDKTLSCFSAKGKNLWNIELPGHVYCTAIMDQKIKGYKAVMVGLDTNQILIYQNNNLVDTIFLEGVPQAICFGKYGRESNTLVTILKSGGLQVLQLKRNTEYSDKGISLGPPASQKERLEIPKKSQLYVDQTIRERNNCVEIFQNFQYDLRNIKLRAAKDYFKSLHLKVTPFSNDVSLPLSLSASIYGIGPTFKLLFTISNSSNFDNNCSKLICGLKMIFRYSPKCYDISPNILVLPALVPEQSYKISVSVSCISSDNLIQDNITAFICKDGCDKPKVTAVISMPTSDGSFENLS